jgi:hypothetical protein
VWGGICLISPALYPVFPSEIRSYPFFEVVLLDQGEGLTVVLVVEIARPSPDEFVEPRVRPMGTPYGTLIQSELWELSRTGPKQSGQRIVSIA